MAKQAKTFNAPPPPKDPTAVPVPLLAVTNPEISAEEIGLMVKAEALYFQSELREWDGRPYRCPDAKPWPTEPEAQAALVGVDVDWWKERKFLWFVFRNEAVTWIKKMRGTSQMYQDKSYARWKKNTDADEESSDITVATAVIDAAKVTSGFPSEWAKR